MTFQMSNLEGKVYLCLKLWNSFSTVNNIFRGKESEEGKQVINLLFEKKVIMSRFKGPKIDSYRNKPIYQNVKAFAEEVLNENGPMVDYDISFDEFNL